MIADLAIEPRIKGRVATLFQKREVKKIAVVHMGTDRGLCGGLNTNLNRHVGEFIQQQKVPVTVRPVGRKARTFARIARLNVRAEFSGIGDRPSLQDTLPIARVLTEDYSNGEVDLVYLAYPRFVSTVLQKPTMDVLLPIEPARLPQGQVGEYIFEPDPFVVLNELLPRFVEMEVYHAILELIASEQSARMELLTIRVVTTQAFGEGEAIRFELAADPLNELADGNLSVIPDAVIGIDAVEFST